MSDPWPGRVLDDHPDNQWPGKVVAASKSNGRGDALRSAIQPHDAPLRDSFPTLPSPVAVDGDTLKSDAGRVRVWGVDAPELTQQGWDRQGNAVPIGQQSRNWLRDRISLGPVNLGEPQGFSYGRQVAPVNVGGTDAGLSSVRTGNALAAPAYVRDNPAYRAKLLDAERLARLNGLGPLNDNYVPQSPAEYRDAPIKPDRETIAQFWDTPTPLQGLPADKEAQLRQLYANGTVEQINAFLSANGYQTSRPADLAAFVAQRDKGAKADTSVTYQEPPPLMTDSGDGATGAAVRKFGSGFLAGGLDEAGAIVDTLGATPGRESIFNSDRRLADIWANNQRQNAGVLSYDQTFHPTASTAGEIAGGLTSGLVIPYGQGARTAAELARVGAAYGAAGGFLSTDGRVPERLKGAAIGAPVGFVLNAGIGKAIEHGAPAIGKRLKWLLGRDATDAAGTAGEAAGEYADETAYNAAQGLPEGVSGDVWPGRVVGESETVRVAKDGPTLDAAPNDRTIGMEADSPILSRELRQRDYIDLSQVARTRPLLDPQTAAERELAAQRVQPRDVLPLASNEVGSAEEAAAAQAGRFAEARVPNERTELSRGTVRNWMGVEVPKVGPTDMVGWLRLRGGLQDQGGELSHMGLTNAARRGLDHVGQEARFGPLVNNRDGAPLDDAALLAWEAGFFPEHTDRPSVNEFLDALRDTYNGGTGRRFLPDDYAELERYNATQAERYDLEQQQHEVGGPVYQDRSVPADEAAPFPPVEAYEEWPSDAIKRVGNIDVTKLDTPQDIARALRTTHNAVGGMDAARRGRITQAETERLASDLGMTADDLLKRQKGQALNAEQALAARQILAKSGNELVNLARRIQRVERPGDEEAAAFQRALIRHAAIQEQVSGATAEAGRALSQFRMMANSRAVPSEVLSGIVDSGGGPRRVKEAADLVLEAIEGPPGRFNTVVRKASSPRFSDKLAELYINNLLSGPQTHVVNAVSNTMTAISQIPENAVAAAIGGARKLVARKEVDRVMGGELGARLFGLMQGTREGLDLFARSLRTGETSDTFSKIAGHDMRAISGVKGEIIRIPGRLLNSADEFFKGMNRRAEINALAYRQAHREGLSGDALTRRIADLSANPTEAIELRGLDFARYMTFQRPLGGLGQKASQLTREYPLLRPVITFVRTPANLLKFATERSPAAPLLKEWRADFMAGGARRDMAIARATLGTGIAATFYMAALDGRVTGSAPTDEAKNRFRRADGWQPYSVRIGDQWISYSRLDPFAIQLGVFADLATKSQGMTDKQLDNYAVLTVASILAQMADKTWLSGVSDFTQALQDPERYGRSYLRRLGASFLIPNLSAQTARTVDPVTRQRDTFGDELQSRIPGLSDNLLPKRDIWGQPITSDNEIGPDLLNPFRQSTIKDDPVNTAMLAIGARSGPPSKQHTVDGKRVDWTPEQYDKLQEIAGREAYSGMAALISQPSWAGMPDAAKRKAADKVFDKARANARNAVLGGGGSAGAAQAVEWPGKPVGGQQPTADAWPGKPVASRDVVGELRSAIPGIRFTSGLRSPEYNESLRARGYHPAKDSEHLDGSALDMLPPPGKSLSWLMQRVKQYDPKARLLVHDGHLHGGFNSFYSAPKMGGMRGR